VIPDPCASGPVTKRSLYPNGTLLQILHPQGDFSPPNFMLSPHGTGPPVPLSPCSRHPPSFQPSLRSALCRVRCPRAPPLHFTSPPPPHPFWRASSSKSTCWLLREASQNDPALTLTHPDAPETQARSGSQGKVPFAGHSSLRIPFTAHGVPLEQQPDFKYPRNITQFRWEPFTPPVQPY